MRLAELFRDDVSFLKAMNWRKVIVIIFFAVQLIMVVAARFTDERSFCWAPHDTQTEFELTVIVNGKELSAEEIRKRFRTKKIGRNPRGVGNIKRALIQHCETYGKDDEVLITMDHKINGIRKEPWKWHHIPSI